MFGLVVLFVQKSDSYSAYFINGIHDVNIDNEGYYALNLTTEPAKNIPQHTVTLSISGLPAGVIASIQNGTGLPPFASTITFTPDFTTPSGVYPIKITSTSSSGNRDYPIKLNVEKVNGWTYDNQFFPVFIYEVVNKAPNPINAAGAGAETMDNHHLHMAFNAGYDLPLNDAVYKVVDTVRHDDEVKVVCEIFNYLSAPTGKTVSMKYVNGKYSFSGADIDLLGVPGGIEHKVLSFDIREK